jgi:hypothetical protein
MRSRSIASARPCHEARSAVGPNAQNSQHCTAIDPEQYER